MTSIDCSRRHLLAAAGAALACSQVPSLQAEEKRPSLKVLLFGGDLPAVRKDLQAKYQLEVFTAGQIEGKSGEDNIAGLEQLDKADVWIGTIQKRTMPSEQQLEHVKKFLAAGKPFVGYRAASHAFQNWLAADKAIWGAKYGGHHLLEKDPELVIVPEKGALEHAILKGLEIPRPGSGSYFYTEVEPDVQVLLRSGLPGDMMPHTWTRQIATTGNRVFYTRYDAKELDSNPVVREIFLRGIAWALAPNENSAQKESR
jgi:type 1 glutamine amidotransferase